MQYFAGLFDAEGYVSLVPNGAFTIAVEMANENICLLFQDTFGGSIYIRKRDNRKQTWIWKINSISDQALNFINKISSFSITKYTQLIKLRDYLDQPKKDRKLTRAITCNTIKALKQPLLKIPSTIPRIEKSIEPYFFEWLAGFLDGDGNFVCNQYVDNRNNKKYFAHQISVANIFIESICFINDRIQGCISDLNRTKNPLYKWTCNRNNEKFVCKSIRPFLKIKSSQCDLFLEFLEFPRKPYGIGYSTKDLENMYRIINQIKHLNSL